jgi:hypothetical protein
LATKYPANWACATHLSCSVTASAAQACTAASEKAPAIMETISFFILLTL